MTVFIIILSIYVLICIVVFTAMEFQHYFFKHTLRDKTNTLRILIVDKKNDLVKYFDKTSIGNLKEKTFSEYIKSFPTKDGNNFSKWIDSLLGDEEGVDMQLEVEIFLKNTKKTKFFSILEAKKVDKKNKIVHLESYLFKFVAEKDNKTLQKSTISKAEIAAMFSDSTNLHGYTTIFKFATVLSDQIEEKVDRLIILQLKELMIKHLKQNSRFLLEISSNEIAIFDMKAASSGSMITLTKAIYDDMSTYLSISGLSYKIKIGGGIIDNKLATLGFDKHIEKAENTARIALEQNESYILYKKNLEFKIGDKEIFKTEVATIINENKLKYFFMPILQLGKNKVVGYLTSVKPSNTFFANFDDAIEYARKTEDLNSLLSFTYSNLLDNFEQKKDPNVASKIYIDANMDDSKTILNFFNNLNKQYNTEIALTFDEANIDYYLKNKYEEMVSSLNEFKAKGFDVCLKMKNKEIIFSESVYSLFTSYIVDFSEFKEERSTTPFRLKLRTIGEKLIKMEKPIIMSEINGWRYIETVMKSGFNFITSETISSFEESPLPIASRFVKKIKEIAK